MTGGEPAGLIGALERRVRSYGSERAVAAFSGGVDSSVVLSIASRALGVDRVIAVTAISPSYPSGELDLARATAASIGVVHRTIRTDEVEREAYARNDGMRCFHCKTVLYATLQRLAAREAARGAAVLAGANADDADDFRPGLRAAAPHGVRNPLLEEGVRKDDVRAVARSLDLAVADKPALACLSSRVAYGIRVTPDLLRRIDRAERAVRDLGFDLVRVRHLGAEASIEVRPSEVHRLAGHRGLDRVCGLLRALGWERVAIDPEGYRPGRLNALLPLVAVANDGRPAEAVRATP